MAKIQTLNARQRLQAARTTLLLDQPFFGTLALRLRLLEDTSAPTAWVDGTRFGYNPGFIETLDADMLLGVVAHEVMHCACGHPWRKSGRNHLKWNVACDFAINGILRANGFKLPEGTLYDPQFDGKSAEWIYDRLPDPLVLKCAAAQGEVRDGQSAPDEEGNPAQTEAQWSEAVAQSAQLAKNRGNLPANMQRAVDQMMQSRVDWRALMRRFMQNITNSDYTWMKPNKRYMSVGMYLPRLHSIEVGPVVIAIDTSGSIDQVLLSQFASEVQAMAAECKPAQITVMYCDTRVHRTDVFTQGELPTMNAVGGGGTRFEPVFDKVNEDGEVPVALIYLTDMYGSFPSEAPEYPVLWVTQTPKVQAPFGETVTVMS